MEKRDSKTVAATKRRITDGLFEIMRDDPIERVTVREVCGRAGITRSTFYTHFSSVYDVRDRCEAEIFERVEELFFPEMLAALAPGRSRDCAGAAQRIKEGLEDHGRGLRTPRHRGDVRAAGTRLLRDVELAPGHVRTLACIGTRHAARGSYRYGPFCRPARHGEGNARVSGETRGAHAEATASISAFLRYRCVSQVSAAYAPPAGGATP